MSYKYLIFFLFFFSFSVEAQKLEGTVSDASGTVSDIMVVVKKKATPNLIYEFTTTDARGYYSFNFEKITDSLTIQVTGFTQESEIMPIDFSKKEKNIVVINLNVSSKNIAIREVIIETKRPISIKNDTTTYNPDSFKDGSERVVEDLLKKLPGIEVKESGQILYKGKPIKKFLLDGDDLFDSQYVIGSRNIDVNMIDKIQAIDKFNENALLKGLIDSDEVALNLKLVKGKSDISGGAELGYGIEDRYQGSITGLLVNAENKGFAVAGYNNLGMNSSPYDFRSSIESVEMFQENDLRPKKLIDEGNFYSQLDSKYHNRNNNFFTSINFLKKVSKKVTLKFNAGVYDDNLKRDNTYVSEYVLNNENVAIESAENISKKPSLYNLNLFLENKSSKSLTWDYASKFNYQEIDFRSRSFNNGAQRNNNVKSYSFFTKQNFNLTKRIDSVSAFKILGIYSNGKSPQNFELSPGFNLDEEQIGNSVLQNVQKSNFTKEVFKLRVDYIKKFRFFNWIISSDYSFSNNKFNSNLTQRNENLEEFQYADFQNNSQFKYQLPSVFSSFTKKIDKKYSVGFAIRSSYYDFDLNDEIREEKQSDAKLILSPTFIYSRYLNNYSRLLFSYKYNAVAPSEENLFQGIVLTGFRSFRNNEPNFEFIKTHSYDLEYNYDNLMRFNKLSIRLSHNNRKNNYFSRTNVNIENTISTMFFMPTSRRDYSLNVNVEQFVYFLRTYFKLYSSYGLGFDKNVINQSDIRDVENRNLNLKLNITPKITDKIQLDNSFTYNSNEFYFDDKKANENQGFELKSVFNYNIQKDFRVKTSFNFLIPNLNSKHDYSFWDFEMQWTPNNKNIQYSLQGQNLFNQKSFTTFYVSDFSSSSSSFTLLERYVFFKINFRF